MENVGMAMVVVVGDIGVEGEDSSTENIGAIDVT